MKLHAASTSSLFRSLASSGAESRARTLTTPAAVIVLLGAAVFLSAAPQRCAAQSHSRSAMAPMPSASREAAGSTSRNAPKSILLEPPAAAKPQRLFTGEPNAKRRRRWPDGSIASQTAENMYDRFTFFAADVPGSPIKSRGDSIKDWLGARVPESFFLNDPDAPNRHVNKGGPLMGTSWLNRPHHAGWFVGGVFGDDLIGGRVRQGEELLGGYRIGRDFSHYWGWEIRFSFANIDISDSQNPPRNRTARNWYVDGDLLYYPWGDARWRPYCSLGLGWASFRFEDDLQRGVGETVALIPIGVGVKYYFRRWLAVRLELTNNIALGGDHVGAMNNVGIGFGAEWRYGARPQGYFPWNPSRHYW